MRHLILMGLVATSACDGSGADSGTPSPTGLEVTDSAGVRVVTNPPGDLVYAELAEEPLLSIGQLTGPDELLFGRIATARRDGAGNVIVADRQAHQIRVFDAGGRHLQTLGREGEGPGEFETLSGAWVVRYRDGTSGDSRQIIAADSELDRITLFSGEGTPMGTATLAGREDMSIRPIGLAGPDAVLSRASPFNLPDFGNLGGSITGLMGALLGGEENSRVLFVLHRLDGALADTLAGGRDPVIGTVAMGDGAFSFAIPFSPESGAAGSPHGVVVTGGTHYAISIFEDGSLRLIARLDESPPARTDEHLERYVRGSEGSDADEAEVRERIERYHQVPLRDSLPAYTDILFAEEGEVWARRYRFADAPVARWDVFAPDGVYLGRVAVPTSFRIEEVSRGQALGVATDELGVERVQIRELTLSGS
ncbi:MAG: hypothetical protein F4087_12355 [Gemmatimonadetes bacterium]|nr:hypothetical protein [Gemmatimonadota bacterium]MYJ69283.1 hypothetical protein [Gemmatimonadota bacterium]